MHEVRAFRRQNPLAPGLERRRRCATVLGRDLQGPAEMLARMTKADAQTVMTADFVIERADIFELLGQGRRGFHDPGFDATPDLAWQPWLALRAAADHDRVGARHFERRHGFLERGDISVNDERNTNGVPDGANRAPIGFAL